MVNYLAIAFLSVGLLAGAPEPPQWEASYGKALEATRDGKSPLLVVLDKPNSEDGRLEPELLGEEELSGHENEMLRPYRLCHVDVTTKYGKKVANAFRAKDFPHVAIIDKTGSMVIFRKSGKIQPREWERILQRHKSGDRSLARTVSRTSYKPSEGLDTVSRPYCPSCQRNSF
ncbi:MAG: hypothetical protein WD738_10890 [Pirellulales bacterium]